MQDPDNAKAEIEKKKEESGVRKSVRGDFGAQLALKLAAKPKGGFKIKSAPPNTSVITQPTETTNTAPFTSITTDETSKEIDILKSTTINSNALIPAAAFAGSTESRLVATEIDQSDSTASITFHADSSVQPSTPTKSSTFSPLKVNQARSVKHISLIRPASAVSEKKPIIMLPATKSLLNRTLTDGKLLAQKLINGDITDTELLEFYNWQNIFPGKGVQASEEYWNYTIDRYNRAHAIYDFVKTIGPALSDKNLCKYTHFFLLQESKKDEKFRIASLGSMFLLYETWRHASKISAQDVNETNLFPITFIYHMKIVVIPAASINTRTENAVQLNHKQLAQYIGFNMIGSETFPKCDKEFLQRINTYCETTQKNFTELVSLIINTDISKLPSIEALNLNDKIDLEYRSLLEISLTPDAPLRSSIFNNPSSELRISTPMLKSSAALMSSDGDIDAQRDFKSLELLTKLIDLYEKQKTLGLTEKQKTSMLEQIEASINSCIARPGMMENLLFLEALKKAAILITYFTDEKLHPKNIISAATKLLNETNIKIRLIEKPMPNNIQNNTPKN